jgi:acetamidase/formamidase
MAHHRLEAGPDTIHWGYFDARLAPRLTVESGDTVTVSTVSGAPEVMPGLPLTIPPALSAIHRTLTPKLPGHICSGPIAVRGARAGQTLEVRINAIELHYDWGYNFSAPLVGALPDDFSERHLMHIPLDRERMIGRLPWGLELPLRPFFGVIAVAPPAAWGAP